uniref:Uncharacterized protein n=1 Tax=Caenorhabditis japonica TaxID=281687 RepID=A0A8R1DY89_CAEJA
MKFMYLMMGHMGPSASCSCMWCLQFGRWRVDQYVRGRGYSPRTRESYEMASKNAGCDSYSVKGSAFFVKVSIANLIPQSLHMLQGLAQHFGFDELKQMANECDLPGIQKQSKTVEKECKSHISAIQSELTELEKQLTREPFI